MNSQNSRAEWGAWAPILLTLVIVAAGATIAFW
jgi:hypothetical protein